MFGYISPNKNELSKEEISTYRGYYCGLCHALKDKAGMKGQILLAYDMTFISLLLSGLYEPKEEPEKFRCMVHPFSKRIAVNSKITDYVADMNILLGYYNLIDNYNDEGKITAKKLAESLKDDVDRITHKYPRQANCVKEALTKLEEAEHCKEENLSLVANLSGQMLSEVFAFYKDDIWSDDLRKIGTYIGKFIYVMDSYEDIEKDRRRHNYNTLILTKANDKANFETYVRQLLTSQLRECAEIFERLPILKNANIIRNILYSGAWMRYDLIQAKRKGSFKESSNHGTEKSLV